MRLVNRDGRLGIEVANRFIDVATRSQGQFSSNPMEAFENWDALLSWASQQASTEADPAVELEELGPPVPSPSQIFAIGLNYKDHAAEAGLPLPESPMVFTKFVTCLAGPNAEVPLTSNRVDWEVEQVVVLGREASRVRAAEAWDYVAGICVGQDISDRRLQFSDKPPQFSLGKSAKAFGPIGPALVSLDEIEDRDAMLLRCWIDGEQMQESTTANLVFPVAELIEYISRYCPLQPGDLIFTGTPGGVGSVRNPRRYLSAGETIESEIEGIGRLSNLCIAGPKDS